MGVTFDQDRFFRALDDRRGSQGLTWRQLARHLEISASTFTRLGRGRRPDVDTLVKLLDWLELPIEAFTSDGEGRRPVSSESALRVIRRALRDDPGLREEDVTPLEEIVTVAYNRFRGASGSPSTR
jgi:transcriptional regulator with XRE-family HTH domain